MKAKDAILMVTLVCSAVATAERIPVKNATGEPSVGTNTPELRPSIYPGIYPGMLPVIPDKNVDVENPSEPLEARNKNRGLIEMMSIIKCIRKIAKTVEIVVAGIFSGESIMGGPGNAAGPFVGDNTTNVIGGGEENEAMNPDVAEENVDVENPSESPESRLKSRGPARRVGTDTPDFWPGTYPGILPVIPDKNVDVENPSRGIGKDFLKNIKTRYHPDW